MLACRSAGLVHEEVRVELPAQLIEGLLEFHFVQVELPRQPKEGEVVGVSPNRLDVTASRAEMIPCPGATVRANTLRDRHCLSHCMIPVET
jgi:hypothetical protein